jgi:hypothetical protein
MPAWSRQVRPYGGRQMRKPHSPVTLRNVELLTSSGLGFKKHSDMMAVIRETVADMKPYLEHHLALATGDWWTYWTLLEAVRTDRKNEFGHLVPIPGVFHMGLNAQEAVYTWYAPVLEPLWMEVAGKPLPKRLRPLQRKYCLDLICSSWKQMRHAAVALMREKGYCTPDAVMLFQLFDEVIPVSLDLYAAFLQGDADQFEALMFRALAVYIQLGKQNYVHAVLLFIATTEHWRTRHADVYESFRAHLWMFSEEEIELYHSILRGMSEHAANGEQLAHRITVHGATEGMVHDWMVALGVQRGRGGCCKERIRGMEERMKESLLRMLTAVVECEVDTTAEPPPARRPRRGGKCRKKSRTPREWQWRSPVLGTLSDRAYPVALQRCKHIYELPNVDCEGIRRPVGAHEQRPFGSVRLCCGHVCDGRARCDDCWHLLCTVASQVMEGLNV